MQVVAKKMPQTASVLASFCGYEQWLVWRASNSNAAADGHIPNDQSMHGVAAATKVETPSMLEAKSTRLTPRMSSKTPAQVERRDLIPTERRDEAIGFREGVNCTLFEDCVVDGLILHKIATKPSYALILKKGRTGARGFALAAAALSSTPAAYKTPTRKRALTRRITTDSNKLYLDSAATYHSLFV